MSFLRRSVFAVLVLYLLIFGVLAFVFTFGVRYFFPTPWALASIGGISFFFFLTLIGYFFTIHGPLKTITLEMKALLTGKSYRRIYTSKTNELGVLAHFFNEVTRNLESIAGNVQTQKRIQKELSAAQEIQALLLPKSAPVIPGLELTAKTHPASELGGDTFDFFNKDDRLIFYIGDSTGHGIPSGIVMVMVDALLETFISMEQELPTMLIKLNQYLKPHLKPSMFMTMILLEWIPSERKIKWVGAGHEHLLHMRSATGEVVAIKAGGLAVGMLPDNRSFVKEQAFLLEENDFIVLYSDGIIEAKNIKGENYTLLRLQNFLQNNARTNISTQDLFEKIILDVNRFMEGQSQADDMTLIVLKKVLQST